VIIRLARPAWASLWDMTENAKAEFGIFVQNLELGYIVGKRACDEFLVFERIAQQLADFLAPRRAWILRRRGRCAQSYYPGAPQ
jgi:hypothetical protein